MDQKIATELVQARLSQLDQPGCTYSIVGAKEYPDKWAIGVQPFRPDGQPFYDVMCFDVLKENGEVLHMR
jgi:hypothetical protein